MLEPTTTSRNNILDEVVQVALIKSTIVSTRIAFAVAIAFAIELPTASTNETEFFHGSQPIDQNVFPTINSWVRLTRRDRL